MPNTVFFIYTVRLHISSSVWQNGKHWIDMNMSPCVYFSSVCILYVFIHHIKALVNVTISNAFILLEWCRFKTTPLVYRLNGFSLQQPFTHLFADNLIRPDIIWCWCWYPVLSSLSNHVFQRMKLVYEKAFAMREKMK